MENTSKTIQINDAFDTMGEVTRNLEKILAVVDQLNNNYFEKLGKPSFNAVISWANRTSGARATEEESLTYDWIIDYERIQSFIEIIEDYLRESKGLIDAKKEEFATGKPEGAA